MKIIICDICGKEMDKPAKSEISLNGFLDASRPFEISVTIGCRQFDTTDFDACNECYSKSVKEAISKMPL